MPIGESHRSEWKLPHGTSDEYKLVEHGIGSIRVRYDEWGSFSYKSSCDHRANISGNHDDFHGGCYCGYEGGY